MQSQTEIRQQITTKIIESLKQGRIPWRKPWTGVEGPCAPTNLSSGHRYAGVNVLLTQIAEMQNGWPISYWATYNQYRKIGCQVRKGEKATTIVFWQLIKKTVTDRDGELKEEKIPILKTWSVFNPLDNTQAYVQSWIQKLENDPKFIFQASSAASKAADYILSFSRPMEADESDVETGAEVSA